jgi:hypothetical protein
LRQINDAGAVARTPDAVVWTEAVAAAVLLGLDVPRPRRHVAELWPGPGRERDCAVAAAADCAVDARRALLRPWVDPDDFGQHLAVTMRALLAGLPYECPDPRRWQAGFYRYIREWVALEEAASALTAAELEQAPPHPQTAEWRTRGLILDGATLAGQLAEIACYPSFGPGSKRVIFGDRKSSGLDRSLAALVGISDAESMAQAFRYVCHGDALGALISVLPEIAGETK